MSARTIVAWMLVAFIHFTFGPLPVLAAGLNVDPDTGAVEGTVKVNKVGNLILADGLALLQGQQINITGTVKDSGKKIALKGKLFKTRVTTAGERARLTSSAWFPQGSVLCPEPGADSHDVVYLADGRAETGRITDVTSVAVKMDTSAGKVVLKMSDVSRVDSPRVVNVGITMTAPSAISATSAFSAHADQVAVKSAWPAVPPPVKNIEEYLAFKELSKLAKLGNALKPCQNDPIKLGKDSPPPKTTTRSEFYPTDTAPSGQTPSSSTQSQSANSTSQATPGQGPLPDPKTLTDAQLKEYVDLWNAARAELGSGAILNEEFFQQCWRELNGRGEDGGCIGKDSEPEHPVAQPELPTTKSSQFDELLAGTRDPIDDHLAAIRDRLEDLRKENYARIDAILDRLEKEAASRSEGQSTVPAAPQVVEVPATPATVATEDGSVQTIPGASDPPGSSGTITLPVTPQTGDLEQPSTSGTIGANPTPPAPELVKVYAGDPKQLSTGGIGTGVAPDLGFISLAETAWYMTDAQLPEYLHLSVRGDNQMNQQFRNALIKSIDRDSLNTLGVQSFPFAVTKDGAAIKLSFPEAGKLYIDSPDSKPQIQGKTGTLPATTGQTTESTGQRHDSVATGQEYVSYQLTGNNSTTQCSLNLTNLSDRPIWFFVPAFTVFVSDNPSYQNMMVVSDAQIELPAQVDPPLNLTTLCVSTKTEKPPPPEGVSFKIGPHPDGAAHKLIVRIFQISQVLEAHGMYRKVPLAPERRQQHIVQLAVWEALGLRSGKPENFITEKSIKSDLLEQSGVKESQLPPERCKAIDDFCHKIFAAVHVTYQLAQASIQAGL